MCQAPRSHPGTSKNPFIIQSPVDFSKKTTRQIQENLPFAFPSLSVLSNNKRDDVKIFSSPLIGNACVSQWSGVSQRFGVFERRGCLAVELYSTVVSSSTYFSSFLCNLTNTGCGNCKETPEHQANTCAHKNVQ